MRFVLLIFLYTVNFTFAQPFVTEWESHYNFPGQPSDYYPLASCASSSGDFWLVNYLDSVPYFVLQFEKFSSDGTRLFEKFYQDTFPIFFYPTKMVADLYGNVYTGGYRSEGVTDVFILKLDSLGNEVWKFQIGGAFLREDDLKGIAVDSLQNVYLYMKFRVDSINNINNEFVSRINADGSLAWTQDLGRNGNNGKLSVINNNRIQLSKSYYFPSTMIWNFDSTGVITSTVQDSINPIITCNDSIGNVITYGNDFLGSTSDSYLCLFDSSGQLMWRKIYLRENIRNLIISQNTIFVLGDSANNFFLEKYDFSGNLIFSENYTDTLHPWIQYISSNISSNNLLITLNTGVPGPKVTTLKYDLNGNLLDTAFLPFCSQFSYYKKVAVNNYGNYFLASDLQCNGQRMILQFYDSLLQSTTSAIRERYKNCNEYGTSIAKDQLGNLLLSTTGYDSSNVEVIRILKYNSAGNFIWKKDLQFNGYQSEYLKSIKCDNQSNTILTGSMEGYGSIGNYSFVIILNSLGQEIGRHIFTSPSDFYFETDANPDYMGNIYFSGTYKLNTADGSECHIAKLNYAGNVLWNNFYFPDTFEYIRTRNSIIDQNSETFILSTYNFSFSLDSGHYNILKLDPNGNSIYRTSVKGVNSVCELTGQILKDNNGDFICYGPTRDTTINNGGGNSWYIVKTDSMANILWDKRISIYQRMFDQPYSACVDLNNNIYFAGTFDQFSRSLGTILKMDPYGNILWMDTSMTNFIPTSMVLNDQILFIAGYDFGNANQHLYAYDTLGVQVMHDSIGLESITHLNALVQDSLSIYWAGSINSTQTYTSDVFLRKYKNLMVDVPEDNSFTSNLNTIVIFPNPASNEVNLSFELQEFGEYLISAHNLMGKLVYSKAITGIKGLNTIKIEMPQNIIGMINISINNNHGSMMSKSMLIID